MKPFSENDITRIKSLINLMDDEDDSIYTIARDHLISMGEIALPYLEVNLRSDDPVLQLRIRDAYEVITAAVLQEQLRVFRTKHKGDVDLEQGVLLISKYGYPQVDMRTFSDIMTFFSSELRSQIDITDAPEEIAGKIGKYFSEQKGFSGGEIDYYDSDFHYLNKVIETKKGVPISLSVVYLLVLRRLNLPVQGIGMPGHFIIRYDFGAKRILADPSLAGKILSPDECRNYLLKMGYSYNSEYLEPVNNKQILERMLRNLVLVFEQHRQTSNVQTMLRCIDILNTNL